MIPPHPEKANAPTIKRTPSAMADGEGPHLCWIRVDLCNGTLDMASVYIPPVGCPHDGKTHTEIMAMVDAAVRAKHARGENMLITGDINVDPTDISQEATRWRALLQDVHMHDITLEGPWATVNTREPFGKQRGAGSHIDTMAVSTKATASWPLKVCCVGSETPLDLAVPGTKKATDHKLVSAVGEMEFKKAVSAPKPTKRVLDLRRAKHEPGVQDRYRNCLNADASLRSTLLDFLTQADPSIEDVNELLQGFEAALFRAAEKEIGMVVVPGERRQQGAESFATRRAFKTQLIAHRAYKRARKTGDAAEINLAKCEYKAAKQQLKREVIQKPSASAAVPKQDARNRK